MGLAALGVYQLVAPLIGLNEELSVESRSIAPVPSGAIFFTQYGFQTLPQFLINNAANGDPTPSCTDQNYYCYYDQVYYSGNPYVRVFGVPRSGVSSCGDGIYDNGFCVGSQTVDEAGLSDAIQQSSAPTADIVQKAIEDSVAKNIDFGESGLITPSTPMSVSAEPVEGPDEVVSTETKPNPDGSTSTIEKTEKAVATPTATGTNPTDIANTWNVSTVTTETTTNNTTNVTTVSTVTNNQGENPADPADVCSLHPEILACQSLDDVPDVDPVDLVTQSVGSFTMPGSVAGSCPEPIVNTLANGQQIVYTYQPVCDYGSALRPFVIILALISAGYIVSGSVRMQS